jgi:hypothetical protein
MKADLLPELTGVMSDGVTQDLWIVSIGIGNNPWDIYQPLARAPVILETERIPDVYYYYHHHHHHHHPQVYGS